MFGTGTKHRSDFNRMIQDAREGKIDLILVKSISRFSRNTLDLLKYVREMRSLGIAVLFEKENQYARAIVED
ncbi:recombinase family protein [Paenibacillus ferrarius]|uniref:recombinase family protein n=1 Tax=Paenibacillus ferrarius TaxID=1469647 RepID=UPI001FC9CDAD|nr:recombinase family protein [Paenibacillus ferrarius]